MTVALQAPVQGTDPDLDQESVQSDPVIRDLDHLLHHEATQDPQVDLVLIVTVMIDILVLDHHLDPGLDEDTTPKILIDDIVIENEPLLNLSCNILVNQLK